MANLLKRRTFSQHVGCQTMAEKMRANVFLRRFQPRIFKCFDDHIIDNLCILERLVRRALGNKQGTGVTAPAVLNVVDDGCSDLIRQRHTVMEFALSANQDFTSPPVDVFKLDRYNLDSAQTQSRQEQQYRIVASTDCIVGLSNGEESFNLFRFQITR